ncbi:hypothetical protein [Paenibacillus nuruki]|uniref:hypothetical protein n=1 Tax=Paenibacillus nuruki TaxID=1886670 RepID=UPI00280592F0|nr:hypothetical protein [Paenibacillus nuruki]CAJ1315939.1 ArpU family transcriptional regulator [Paenibacillus nuruki]
MEWFPEATAAEAQAVRNLLRRYPVMRRTVSALSQLPNLTEKQNDVQQTYQLKIRNIELAVNLIMDEEVKNMIEYRFIKGHPRKAAVNRFRLITDRSVDRKIREGISSIANTLKLMGEI